MKKNTMSRRLMRGGLGVAVALSAALTMSGCSVLEDLASNGKTPVRDDQGSVVEGGKQDVFTIKVGDCVNVPNGDTVSDLKVIPCDTEHDAELYYEHEITQDDLGAVDIEDGYPGEDAVHEVAARACESRFTEYVGVDYETSALDYDWFYPTEDGWDAINDRTIQCFLFDGESGKLTGALAGSGR